MNKETKNDLRSSAAADDDDDDAAGETQFPESAAEKALRLHSQERMASPRAVKGATDLLERRQRLSRRFHTVMNSHLAVAAETIAEESSTSLAGEKESGTLIGLDAADSNLPRTAENTNYNPGRNESLTEITPEEENDLQSSCCMSSISAISFDAAAARNQNLPPPQLPKDSPCQFPPEGIHFEDSSSSSRIYTTAASPDSDFEQYNVLVDPTQSDRAVDIPLYSNQRPHARAFHLAWTAFFVAFFTWFAMTPLLSEIAHSLQLDHEQIWNSSVLAVTSSALTRLLMGPLCDRYGARWMMSGTLIGSAIPMGLAGWVVRDATSLYLIRLFIGVAGSAFVTCQYWTSSMFTVEIAGTANALSAGWGNVGGGMAQIVIGSMLFPLFKVIYQATTDEINDGEDNDEASEHSAELAWRTVLIFPALLSLIMAAVVVRYGDDTPKGNIQTRRRQNLVEPVSLSKSFHQAVANANTWLLFLHYGCCFGVEITMTQAAALYFQEEFGQSTESAAAIASIFGWMNLFARGIGGFCSDMANSRSGLRGRLWCQVFMLIGEGLLVIAFSYTHHMATSIVVMVIFSIFVQAAEGCTFGIVPYVDSKVTGSVAGIVGAGGNVGGICFALLFRAFPYRTAFLWMGCTVVASAVWTLFIAIPGHRRLLNGEDASDVLEHRRKAKIPEIVILEPHGRFYNAQQDAATLATSTVVRLGQLPGQSDTEAIPETEHF